MKRQRSYAISLSSYSTSLAEVVYLEKKDYFSTFAAKWECRMKGKVIFLDIDGVLNTKYWYTQMDSNTPKDKYGYAFDTNAVANLKKIVDDTGAEIVISSSWKCMGLSLLKEMWKQRELPGKIIGITLNSVSNELLLNTDLNSMEHLHIRGAEIREWLRNNSKHVSHYVILDDMDNVLAEQRDNFVWIDPNVGITDGNAVQAILILTKMEYDKEDLGCS